MPLRVATYAGANLLYGYLSFITAALPVLKNPIRMKVMYLLHFLYYGIPKGLCPFGGFGQRPFSIIAQRYLFPPVRALDIGIAL